MTLQEIVSQSKNIVFFGGAGVSTESGIPDFRSKDGLYRLKYDVPPETILSADYFFSHTEEFYRFYKDKMLPLGAMPNAAHLRLAEWEKAGKLSAVVTQNIDGLHQKAGSSVCTNCTVACTVTAVLLAERNFRRKRSRGRKGFPVAIAAD